MLVPLVEVVVDDGSLSIGSGSSPSVAPRMREGEEVGKGIIDQGKKP